MLARKAVQQAMELKDQKQLEAAIARYKDTGVPDDDPALVKAQKLLTALQAKAGRCRCEVDTVDTPHTGLTLKDPSTLPVERIL